MAVHQSDIASECIRVILGCCTAPNTQRGHGKTRRMRQQSMVVRFSQLTLHRICHCKEIDLVRILSSCIQLCALVARCDHSFVQYWAAFTIGSNVELLVSTAPDVLCSLAVRSISAVPLLVHVSLVSPLWTCVTPIAHDQVVDSCSTVQNQNGDKLAGKTLPSNVAKYFAMSGSDVLTLLAGQSQSKAYTCNGLAMTEMVQCVYDLHAISRDFQGRHFPSHQAGRS
jgi:hypothetical protein